MAHEQVFGLLGRKLGHSWSVPIHTALGCAGYRLIELEPEELPAFLAREDIGGLNVTIPYKMDVMPLCDKIDDRATAVACARQLGAREVVVISRSGPDNYENLSRHADADIVVNTTPVGMYPGNGAAPVDLTAFPRCRGVLDVIYNPHRTALLLQAQALGIPCSDGLAMLVAQAKAAEEHFFSRSIPDGETERILSALRHETENIVLIGMPGCGKSTIGAALAALTGREAVDIDAEIERRADCPIPEIFARGGEAEFRALERQATAEAGKRTGCILLTGGGAVKTPENYGALRQNGRIYHLLRDVGTLPTDGRPLSQGADLAAMWRERKPLYERFRDTVFDNNGPAEETAQAIWRDFCAYSGD